MLRWIKEKFINWLVKDVIIEELRTKKLIDKGNTLYVDIADFDHNASDGSPTESQMWYNSTDHVLRYRNDTETIDIGGGIDISDADAAVEDVKSSKTFYAGAEPKKTGTKLTSHYYTISDDILKQNDVMKQLSVADLTKHKQININDLSPSPVTMRTWYQVQKINSTWWCYSRVYKNGSPFGTSNGTQASGWHTWEEDLIFAEGDTYEIWARCAVTKPTQVRNQRIWGILTTSATSWQNADPF